MGWYLVLSETPSGGGTWWYFSREDYQMGVTHRHWSLWKQMFDCFHTHAYEFATEAEAKDVMRCLGNFAPHLRQKMWVRSKESVERVLIQKALMIELES